MDSNGKQSPLISPKTGLLPRVVGGKNGGLRGIFIVFSRGKEGMGRKKPIFGRERGVKLDEKTTFSAKISYISVCGWGCAIFIRLNG